MRIRGRDAWRTREPLRGSGMVLDSSNPPLRPEIISAHPPLFGTAADGNLGNQADFAADKATLTFSAEKDGKIRVTYEWDDAKAVPFGYRFEVV